MDAVPACGAALRLLPNPHLPLGASASARSLPPLASAAPACHCGGGKKATASHGEKTAIAGQLHPRDVGGLVRSEEKVGVGDLLNAAIASHRHGLQHAGAHLRIGG